MHGCARLPGTRQHQVSTGGALSAQTADIDQNGFVAKDELVAMEGADPSDGQILQRLRATDAVFDLDRQQAQDLVDAGLSPDVVAQLESINREDWQEILGRVQ